MAFQPTRTQCLRGHEFTTENTQWVNTPSGRSRLCRICSRTRVRRFLDKQPKKRATALPPLPRDDAFEMELERYIRRFLRARAPQRANEFWADVEARLEHHAFQVKCEPYRVPLRQLALEREAWPAYAARTNAGWHDREDWFVCRMLDDPRIKAMLRKARSMFIIVEPGELKLRPARIAERQRCVRSSGRAAARHSTSPRLQTIARL